MIIRSPVKKGTDNCVKFVDILGLRTLFPLFMKTPARNKRAGVSSEEHEERTVSILASLLKNVTGVNNASKQRERILVKFTENDHEKVDRSELIEMSVSELVPGF